MCRVLEVSRSGYYKWKSKKPGKRHQYKAKFEELIKNTYEDFKARYGLRRFAEELNTLGWKCSINFIAKIMLQYRAQKYIDFAQSKGCQLSMSRRGNCWDNAPMELFFSRLKVELIYPNNYQSLEELKAGVFEYIEIFYCRKRKHSAIGYLSPAEYEEQTAIAA